MHLPSNLQKVLQDKLPIKDYECLMSYLEIIWSDISYSEKKYKSLLESSKYYTVVKETQVPKKVSLYARREEIRNELIDGLMKIIRDSPIKQEVIQASSEINKILEGK